MSIRAKKQRTRPTRVMVYRRLWLNLHLWLGLGVGGFWVLLGLTGSFNVFRWDIDEWLNPKLVVANPGTAVLSLDRIFEAIRAAYPAYGQMWSLEMPRHEAGMLMARHVIDAGNILFVSVNPYTGEIIAERKYGDFDFFITWIYELHYSLFLGETGAYVVGVFGLLLMVSLLIGVYLWWPRTGNFAKALAWKHRASRQRRVYDLHKLAGVYGFVALLVIAFSGTCMVFSDYVRPFVARLSPVYGGFNPQPAPPEGLKSQLVDGLKPIGLTAAITAARHVFPEAAVRFVKTPAGVEGFYGIQMRQPNEASQFFTTTSVWVDQYNGRVLAVRDPNRFTPGEIFLNLLWPLHNGEAFGLAGRILIFVAGFIPLVLFVTGIMRWLQKRRGK